jgi:hypothetical protein
MGRSAKYTPVEWSAARTGRPVRFVWGMVQETMRMREASIFAPCGTKKSGGPKPAAVIEP